MGCDFLVQRAMTETYSLVYSLTENDVDVYWTKLRLASWRATYTSILPEHTVYAANKRQLCS